MTSINQDEDQQLRAAVFSALDSKGVLNKIRAKLRAEVFEAIQDSGKKPAASARGDNNADHCQFDNSSTNISALALVFDFLNSFGFESAAKVLSAECGIVRTDASLGLEAVSKVVGFDVTLPEGGEKCILSKIISRHTATAGTPPNEAPPPPPPPSSVNQAATASVGGLALREKTLSPGKMNTPPKKGSSSKNVRLDISDDSVEDIQIPSSSTAAAAAAAMTKTTVGGSNGSNSPSPASSSSPNKLESLDKTANSSKLSPLSSSAGGSANRKPKLASLPGATSGGNLTIDPFSKPKLPSPTPSPSESLESSLELTSNSLSISFGGPDGDKGGSSATSKSPGVGGGSDSFAKSAELKDDANVSTDGLKGDENKNGSSNKSSEIENSKTSSPVASPARTSKTDESYEDDYEDDYESGGSFDDVNESIEEIG